MIKVKYVDQNLFSKMHQNQTIYLSNDAKHPPPHRPFLSFVGSLKAITDKEYGDTERGAAHVKSHVPDQPGAGKVS